MNTQETIRKTFNVYLDLELVKLVDLWAYREGKSRSQIIETALADCFPDAPNEGHSRISCGHVDLAARWNSVREARRDPGGTKNYAPILGEEHVPE